MKNILPLIVALTASTASADVTRAVDAYILLGYTAFAQKAELLNEVVVVGYGTMKKVILPVLFQD